MAIPSIPTGLQTRTGQVQNVLTWQPVEGATSYKVIRDGRLESPVAEGITETTYTDVVMVDGNHAYNIVATNDDGDSEMSYFVKAVAGGNLPVAPGNIPPAPKIFGLVTKSEPKSSPVSFAPETNATKPEEEKKPEPVVTESKPFEELNKQVPPTKLEAVEPKKPAPIFPPQPSGGSKGSESSTPGNSSVSSK